MRELKAFAPGMEMKGWIAISERLFRPAVAQMRDGEEPSLVMRGDACDPGSIRRARVEPHEIGWFLTEEPVAILGRTLRIYDHRTE
jgi:hypothetical protein